MQFGRNRGSEVHLDLAGTIYRNTILIPRFCSRTAHFFKLKLYFDEIRLWLVSRDTSWFPNRPSCMSSIFSVSAFPFLGSMVPYISSSICFHAMSPHVSLHSWTKHTNFFIVRKKSALSHCRVNTNASLTGKQVFMFLYQIVSTSHALT